MKRSFFEKLEERCRRSDSLLCVCLDPRPAQEGADGDLQRILEHNRRVIEETQAVAACYKPNIAFYEALGPGGLETLKRTLEMIPQEVPVILDAKRNDIGQTAWAYARALFHHFGAEAVTLNPYLGRESVLPFLEYPGRALFMLCRTSNPGAGAIQALQVLPPGARESAPPGQDPGGAEPRQTRALYREIAREVCGWGADIGLVVGATVPEALRELRRDQPERWILCPGIGAQGGDLGRAVASGIRSDRLGLLCAVGRSIYADARPGERARELREQINRACQAAGSAGANGSGTGAGAAGRRNLSPQGSRGVPEVRTAMQRVAVLEEVIRLGCLRFGQFRLKSGAISPYYLDLRRLVASPGLLGRVGSAYASLLRGLRIDRIAAVPLAALPIGAAVCLATQIPLIYPRLAAKDHGTGNAIEGDYRPGERVVLLDDVLSSATSKLEAIRVLRQAGLVVEELAVLVDRESGGVETLREHGVRVHAYARISELFAIHRGLEGPPCPDSPIAAAAGGGPAARGGRP